MRPTVLAIAVALLGACTSDTTTISARPSVAAEINALTSSAQGDTPVLLARAIYPADAYQPGPPSGTLITGDNGATPPFPGQPIPGFSAVLDAGDGTFW